MKKQYILAFIIISLILMFLGCTKEITETTQIKHFAINKPGEIISKDKVVFDAEESIDGNGSIRVNASGKRTVARLFRLSDINLENGKLIFQAKIHTKNVVGRVYLEMWCEVNGGEYFSRSIQPGLTGTLDWKTVSTPFIFKEGQNPDIVRLNFVVEGEGTAWIDDIKLFEAPLK